MFSFFTSTKHFFIIPRKDTFLKNHYSLVLTSLMILFSANLLAQDDTFHLALFDPIQIVPSNESISGVRLNIIYSKNANVTGIANFCDYGYIFLFFINSNISNFIILTQKYFYEFFSTNRFNNSCKQSINNYK